MAPDSSQNTVNMSSVSLLQHSTLLLKTNQPQSLQLIESKADLSFPQFTLPRMFTVRLPVTANSTIFVSDTGVVWSLVEGRQLQELTMKWDALDIYQSKT